MNNQLVRSVAIIGAGASGLVTLKKLRDAGLDVVAFEGGSEVGGLWVYENDNGLSSAYQTLHINTDRKRTAYEDWPFPKGLQPYPDHREMAAYFHSYAEHFDLLRHIHFRTWVDQVSPTADESGTAKWKVRTRNRKVHTFDAVIIATGHLSHPNHVEEFQHGFGGDYLHAHDYRDPKSLAGKRTCIVGVGNSAADISTDICMVAHDTVIVARSGVLIRPKFIFGVPFPDITMRLQKPWIPRKIRAIVGRWLTRLVHGRMEALGFLPLTENTHPTSNATLVNHILYNHIRVKQGITKIEGTVIHFTDGTQAEFDVLIGATGYSINLPFLEGTFNVEENQLDLYMRIVPPELPNLYFLGFANSTDLPLNFMFERQAEWLSHFLTGRASLPTPAEMQRSVESKRRWMNRVYRHTRRHTLEEEMLPYTSELRRSLAEGFQRTGYKPTNSRWKRQGLGSLL